MYSINFLWISQRYLFRSQVGNRGKHFFSRLHHARLRIIPRSVHRGEADENAGFFTPSSFRNADMASWAWCWGQRVLWAIVADGRASGNGGIVEIYREVMQAKKPCRRYWGSMGRLSKFEFKMDISQNKFSQNKLNLALAPHFFVHVLQILVLCLKQSAHTHLGVNRLFHLLFQL